MKKSPANGSRPLETVDLKKALEAGLERIESAQEVEGGFPSLSSKDISFKGGSAARKTAFVTSLILLALEPLKEREETIRIASRATIFLSDQKSPHWSWNYWVRGSEDSRKLPCPDDLDDTFAALEAIRIHAPDQIDGAALASVVKALTAAEEKPGGPYNTWLVDSSADQRWHDIDPVVNGNILAFLKSQDIALPPVRELIDRTVRRISGGGPVDSKYYSAPIPALYFLSRSLSLKDTESTKLISDFLIKKRGPEGHWSNPIETACAVTTLIRCNASREELQPAIEYMFENSKDGEWKPYGLYTETAFGGEPSYAGSAALSTAVCLQALSLYEQARAHKPSGPIRAQSSQAAPAFSQEALGIEQRIKEAFGRRFGSDAIMGRHGQKVLDAVSARDSGKQITLLPYFFKRSLRGSDPEFDHATEAFLVDLGLANLYGWIAYRIYDDFLDDEGAPELIPLGAVCLREVSAIYARLLPGKHLETFTDLMDKMDSANAWERESAYFPDRSFLDAEARLPDFEDHAVLADKSLPHCLGPIAVIVDMYGEDRQEEARIDIHAVTDFFRHYIIARQLNDDAHDWLEDLERGFVNSAGTRLLKSIRRQEEAGMKTFAFRERSGRAEDKLSAETAGFLQRTFWHKVMPGIARDIRREIDASRKALVSIASVSDLSYLESLLLPLEAGADKAMADRQKTLAFLSEYKKAY